MSLGFANRALIKSTGGGIPADGLIGEWLFAGNANDTSGNGNNGIVSGATLTNGKDGDPNSAYSFTGSTTDNINIGDNPPLIDIPNTDFTLSFWVFDTLTLNTLIGTVFSSWKGGNFGLLVRTTGSGAQANRKIDFHIYYDSTILFYESDHLLVSSTWTNLMITFNNSAKTAKIYLDGVEATYNTQTPGVGNLKSDTGNDKIFGALRPTISSQTFRGNLDLIRFYNRILTSEEITLLVNE